MAPAGHDFTVRRIVVAVDSSAHGRAALETAAKLAARFHAEILGIFIEDINLVRLSGLTVGREVRLISGIVREFDPGALEEQMRSEAAQARRSLELHASQAQVKYSFRVLRGRVDTEVISAAGDADLLVLGTTSRPLGSSRRAGSTALAAAERAPRSVLLLRRGAVIAGKPMVVYDGSDGAELALDAALRIVGDLRGTVAILLVAPSGEDEQRLRARVEERLEPHGVKPRFTRVDRIDLDELCRLSRVAGADILIVRADDPVLADKGHRRLIERIGCPILLVK